MTLFANLFDAAWLVDSTASWDEAAQCLDVVGQRCRDGLALFQARAEAERARREATEGWPAAAEALIDRLLMLEVRQIPDSLAGAEGALDRFTRAVLF